MHRILSRSRTPIRTAALVAALFIAAMSSPQTSRAEGPPAAAAQAGSAAARGQPARCATDGTALFARTELFFGLSRPGGVITDAEFKAFVDARVTPRFPDGLTLLSGAGQFRDATGTIVVEGSKLLILLYPHGAAQANQKIEQIRADYKQQFQQQSVLRADDLSCVGF